MELKVGMYVRNENGISKYLGLGKDVLTNDESNQFKHYANQHLFDRNIFDVGHDWGDTLSDEEFKNIDKYIEKEPSYDVIDLIEVGDYVNEVKVTEEMIKMRDEQGVFGLPDKHRVFIDEIKVKNIVTKEQFNAIKYIVKED